MMVIRLRLGGLVLSALFLAACSGGSSNSAPTTPLAADEINLTPQQLLGKRIFSDTHLSEPNGMSCASCHQANQGFSGNNGSQIGTPLGSRPMVFGVRNSPSMMYASFIPAFHANPDEEDSVLGGLFWDGRTNNLVEQAQGPFLNPLEMNNPSKAAVINKINAGSYSALFKQVFGEQALNNPDKAYEQVAMAIAAFEATPTFAPFNSKYDQMLAGKATFTPNETEGLRLFMDTNKGNCAACHTADPSNKDPKQSLFTNFEYYASGIPRNTAIPVNTQADFYDLGLCGPDRNDFLQGANANLAMCGKFKMPSLRNTAKKTAWMHNGYFKNLNDVVSFYATRDTHPDRWYPKGNKFDDLPVQYKGNVEKIKAPLDRKLGDAPRLNPAEIALIVQFLHTLNDQ